MKNVKLICTNCKKEYINETANLRCLECNEPLEVEEIKMGKIDKEYSIGESVLKRYKDFFPFLNYEKLENVGEGYTSLANSKRLSKKFNVENIYFKNESQNPTWSFKDRGTMTGVLRAVDKGYDKIGTVSTGNMATSVAAYGSKFDLKTYILVKKEILEEKLKPIAIYNPKLIKVDGDYGKLYDESIRIGNKKGIYFINSDAPFRVEGYKTLAFEICEQVNFNVPDYVIVPTSAGGNIRGIEKGFREFKNVGYIDKIPKMIAVQASGCSPIYKAYNNGSLEIEKYENPETIAHAIKNPYPPSGNATLRMLKRNKGMAICVDDSEILIAQKEMAKEGIFGQPASSTALAGVAKLQSIDFFKPTDRIVCVVTASGLKDTTALSKHNFDISEVKLENLENLID